MADQFWLNDMQWAVIEPLLPQLGGKPCVDGRRVISGILHRCWEGLCWRAVPAGYGRRTTLFNRFDRWSEKGLWQGLLAALVVCKEPPDFAMVNSAAVRAKRGSRTRQSAARAADPRPKSTRSRTEPAASMPWCLQPARSTTFAAAGRCWPACRPSPARRRQGLRRQRPA